MAQNLVVQLLLKTGTFSTDLKTAKGQIQNFEKGCNTAGKSLSAFGSAMGINIGTITKLGGAIGAAALAGKGFKAVIDSNQKSADAFESVMYSCKNAVGELAYAIGTFDFSNFNNGLSDLIRRGKEAAAAIDQLGNTLMSYDIVRAETNQKMSRARAIINNPEATKEQKDQAMKDLKDAMDELKSSSSVLLDDYKDAMIKEVAARGVDLTGAGAMDILTKWLKADTYNNREEVKKAAEEGLRVMDEEIAKLNSDPRFKTVTTVSGGNTGYLQTITGVNTQDPEYQKALNDIRQNHKEELAYRVLLEKYSNDELKTLGSKRLAMIQTEQVIDDLTTQMERLANKNKQEVTYKKDSLEYWKKIAQVAEKNRDSEVYDSEQWHNFNNALETALNKITSINLQMKKMADQSLRIPTMGGIAGPQTVESTQESGLAGVEVQQYLNEEEINARINALLEKRKGLKENEKNRIGEINVEINELQKRLQEIQSIGIDLPDPTTATDSWNTFNQAMANTATIVNALTNTFRENAEVTAASVLQMVATALPAIGSLISAIGALTAVEATEAGVAAVGKAVTTSKHWIEAIAAVAALGSVVAAAISSASSNAGKVQKFASGGIVGGTSYTGDRVSANVNSGEMILNKSQQTRLFKMANGGTVAGGNEVTFHISGTDLVGVLNNQNRKNRLIG